MNNHRLTKRRAPAAIAITLATAIAISMACVHSEAAIYVKIPNIGGDVTTNGYNPSTSDTPDNAGVIPVESLTSEVTRNPVSGTIIQIVRFKRHTDAASVALVQAFLDGTVFDEVTAGDTDPRADINQLWGDWYLVDCTITSYTRTTGGSDHGMEEFALVANTSPLSIEREMKDSGEKRGSETALTGDANLDGTVDANDLNATTAATHTIREIVPDGVALPEGNESGDAVVDPTATTDGLVNPLDALIIINHASPNQPEPLFTVKCDVAPADPTATENSDLRDTTYIGISERFD